jgi:Bacterial SH3 domain
MSGVCTVCFCVQCVCPPSKIIYVKGPHSITLEFVIKVVLVVSIVASFGISYQLEDSREYYEVLPDDANEANCTPQLSYVPVMPVSSCPPIALALQSNSSSSNLVTVRANAVNVRSSPELEAPIIDVLFRDDTIEVAVSIVAPSGWTPVRLSDGRLGFVANDYVN